MSNQIFAEAPRQHPFLDRIERTKEPNILENYFTDESRVVIGNADEVIFPKNEKDVSEILREADESNIKVTISGAGTGIVGSRVPLGGIVLSTERMIRLDERLYKDGLVEHEEGNIRYSICIRKDEETNEPYAIAPPGIPLEIFKKIVETVQLYYPPDPTETTALLGATVATNASGARTFVYGATREYVRRLRIVLPNGEVLDVKRGQVHADKKSEFVVVSTNGEKLRIKLHSYDMPRVGKNAAGYYLKPGMDIIDLFIGSEGTLGVISEVQVKLVEKPRTVVPVFAHFSHEIDSLSFAKKLRQETRSGKLRVLSIEFFDKHSVEIIKQKYPPPKVPQNSNGIIFFEQEIPNEDSLDLLEATLEMLENQNALDTTASLDPDWQTLSKEMRHAVPEEVNTFVRSHGTHKVATDIAVPDEGFDEMMKSYYNVGGEAGMPYVIFGHIGDNHVHFNFLPRNEEELEKALKLCTILLKKAVALGGTVSGEHGVGKKAYVEDDERKPYLELMYGEIGLQSIATIKNAIDPNHTLNIGNIVPIEYLEREGAK